MKDTELKRTCVLIPIGLFHRFKSHASKRHLWKRGYTRVAFIEALMLYCCSMPLLDKFYRETFPDLKSFDDIDKDLFDAYSVVTAEVVRLGIEEYKRRRK